MKRKFNRSSSWRCVEYWVNRGYSEEDAVCNISRKQKEISSNIDHTGMVRSEKSRQRMSETAQQRNSESYWIEKYGSDVGIDRFNNHKRQLVLNGKKTMDTRKANTDDFRTLTPRCVEFWIKKGYTVDEASIKVSETQSTFSLSKCIQLHGEDEGVNVWQRRQDLWRKSYSKNNKENIRLKQKLNASDGMYSINNIPSVETLLFYLIKIKKQNQVCLKYGLTKHADVTKRWGIHTNKFEYSIICQFRLPSYQAILLESSLRDKFKNTSQTTVFNLTEIVDCDKGNDVMEIINNFKQEIS